MYAVVESGGLQFKVKEQDRIKIPRVDLPEGSEIVLSKVLVLFDDDGNVVSIGTPVVDGATVRGTVVSHGREPKILVFKIKRRKNYRRFSGHRQHYTEVEITEVKVG
jgi:large subunit ribosomal protein L21